MSDSTPYNMPKEPGRWRAILLATVVHAALFGLLWFGIRWQNETPVAVEAEVWSPQAREAAPRPKPVPEPEVKPEPAPPEPRPVIKDVPKPPAVEEPAVKEPDIALEQEKKRIEEKKRLDDEKQKEKERLEKQRIEKERLEKERLEKARLEEERQQKLAEQRAEEKRIEKEKQEKLAAAKKKAEAEELRKKLAEEQAAAERLKEQLAAEEKAAEKRHQENLERMTAQAGAGGASSAPKTQGGRADSGYAGRVGSKIKSNTVFDVSGALDGNPPVEYEVQLLPDGSLRSMRKIRSSGVPGFDEAVARAIERSSPFPPDRTGMVPSSFNVIHRPKDQ